MKLPLLHGKNNFSVVDTKKGYWHVELDYSSSLLCPFNTPSGRYRFMRLPFGVVVSPDVLQRKLEVSVKKDSLLVYALKFFRNSGGSVWQCKDTNERLGYERCGFDTGLRSSFFLIETTLNNRSTINPLLSDLFLFKALRVAEIKPLAQVVQTLDSAIHRTNHYPA